MFLFSELVPSFISSECCSTWWIFFSISNISKWSQFFSTTSIIFTYTRSIIWNYLFKLSRSNSTSIIFTTTTYSWSSHDYMIKGRNFQIQTSLCSQLFIKSIITCLSVRSIAECQVVSGHEKRVSSLGWQ